MNTNKFVRINHYITVPQVRLVDDQGRSEILNTYEAKERANQAELDLVEIVPQARPPVCKIMDFGKWKYEENIKKKEEAKKQKTVSSKQIELRYCIGEHDLDTKIRALKKFLEEKRQVRLIVKFKNRELAYVKDGEALLLRMTQAVTEIGESVKPKLEGKNLIVNVMPKG
jgi:translation initiation factor IF-3